MRLRPTRGNTIVVGVAVGAAFIAGLAVHGVVGGVLLLLVLAVLLLVSRSAKPHRRGRGSELRGLILALVLVLAALKLAGRI